VTQGAFGACMRTVINFIPWGKILKAGEIIADFWKGAKALIAFGKEVEKAEKVIVDTEKVLADADKAANAAADAERAASEVAHGAEEAKGAESGASCALHSFVAGTLVLLADGSAKPIEQVYDGDVVRTTDPATGAVEDHEVVGTLVHDDEDERTEVTLDSGGTVVATDWHLVWVEEAGDWTPISSLEVDEHHTRLMVDRSRSRVSGTSSSRRRSTTSRWTRSTTATWVRSARRSWSTTVAVQLIPVSCGSPNTR
jgi:hypothetical protein